MQYHIDTGLIYQEFQKKSDCPLCEIEKKVEEQLIYEFLNDAVMDENTRLKVAKYGFCKEHYQKLFEGKNKLSLALQISSRLDTLKKVVKEPSNVKSALNQAKEIYAKEKTCAICELQNQSMEKYYKTCAELFYNEERFFDVLFETKGFCLHHYAKLLEYARYAKSASKNYVKVLQDIQTRSLDKLQKDLKFFCDKHDYRNANVPFGDSETALLKAKIKLYQDK